MRFLQRPGVLWAMIAVCALLVVGPIVAMLVIGFQWTLLLNVVTGLCIGPIFVANLRAQRKRAHDATTDASSDEATGI